MQIVFKRYFIYKFLNSLFFGLSAGTIFTIYEPIPPIVYSIGGIVLAVGMLIVAYFYKKLINKEIFFIVLLLTEIVTLFLVLVFLVLQKSLLSALIIYMCYQITFLFGSYVVRVETIILKHIKLFTISDSLKQIGYLVGLLFAFVFYKLVKNFGIEDKVLQIYYIHYMLIVVQLSVILFLFNSFVYNRLNKR
ncbi:MAG: hypothetical protein LBG67_00070 [Campylobacteraceae bacterium]|jgi:hypothetical protein|nr:hypothetical protein [Campylobacteraceae bacterium]